MQALGHNSWRWRDGTKQSVFITSKNNILSLTIEQKPLIKCCITPYVPGEVYACVKPDELYQRIPHRGIP